MFYKWKKPLLVMYYDNYRYGTGLYVPTVNSLDSRNRDMPYLMSSLPSPISQAPKAPLMDYDLYAPISFGYGRSLLKPRYPPNRDDIPRNRMSSRYYPFYYGIEGM